MRPRRAAALIARPLNASVRRPIVLRQALALVAGLIILAACQQLGDGAGVDATLETAPDWGCISSVARNLDSVKIVREESNPTGRLITWHGLAPPGKANTLLYELGGITYALQLINAPKESIGYRNYSIFPRDTASAAALATSFNEAVNLAAKVESACHVVGLVGKLSKYCRGKACSYHVPVA